MTDGRTDEQKSHIRRTQKWKINVDVGRVAAATGNKTEKSETHRLPGHDRQRETIDIGN